MNDLEAELADVGPASFTARDYQPGLVQHIVLFRFRDAVTDDERREVADRFRALAESPRPDGERYIVSISAGEQTSGERAGHGFELGFVVTFASEGDRHFYVGAPVQNDPAYFDHRHGAFKEFVGPLLETGGAGVLVFDFADPARA